MAWAPSGSPGRGDRGSVADERAHEARSASYACAVQPSPEHFGAGRNLDPGADELLRLRDAYLEAWTDDYDLSDLVETARLAVRVDAVSPADCFRRAVLEWDESGRGYRTMFDEGVPSWLRDQRGPTSLDPSPA